MNSKIKITTPIEDLIQETRTYLVSLNYTENTMRHMNNCWKALVSYAKTENANYFTTELGHKFLKERYGIEAFATLKTSYERNLRRSVMILSDYQRN